MRKKGRADVPTQVKQSQHCRNTFSRLQHLNYSCRRLIHFNKTLMKSRNNGLKCKEMKNYCTVLLKLAEKFSIAASQGKPLASLSANDFLGSFGHVRLPAHRIPKIFIFYKLITQLSILSITIQPPQTRRFAPKICPTLRLCIQAFPQGRGFAGAAPEGRAFVCK